MSELNVKTLKGYLHCTLDRSISVPMKEGLSTVHVLRSTGRTVMIWSCRRHSSLNERLLAIRPVLPQRWRLKNWERWSLLRQQLISERKRYYTYWRQKSKRCKLCISCTYLFLSKMISHGFSLYTKIKLLNGNKLEQRRMSGIPLQQSYTSNTSLWGKTICLTC